ncbi:MAG: metal-dependent hydrolase [Proteobacteria bacterium]|nr:metal-dependent hydrolase [Pseudomonadota bacterium]
MNSARMTVRRPAFSYPSPMPGHWNARRPEFSHIVNAASLAMPYLEPYLIKSMRAARERIRDPELKKALDDYVAQESMHFSQHRRFNDTLQARGYRCIEALQARMAADYAELGAKRSLEFNLAYAEGFESMALAIGEMLIEDREHLFGASESGVATLVLWHFVEEIEHKNVAFDVFEHVAGGYFRRVHGFLYATAHIFKLTRDGYHALLQEDGLWRDWRSRLALARLLARIFAQLTPRLLRILVPGYNPRQVADPPWARAWAALFDATPQAAARLDTTRLAEPTPVPLA